ncbi:MAG: tRNA (adenosine(37)-N6)-threonylcarbamoyltransferase complex transferase subunit TsaD [Burkholderiales bacterium]|nr:tRNA (adenosine(37)-N6)-threonylcarbamoyltransferase complex transferase subunit TsaD [Burkholderiales bacterium]
MSKAPVDSTVLGIETSCDETGVAVYSSVRGLLAHTLHSQVELHAHYGGVVPELASRDHVRRLLPLVHLTLERAGMQRTNIAAIAYTAGPGLAGALLVGASLAQAAAYALKVPALAVHHLEAHLLSPLMSSPAPRFPFIALLVSGGHSQLMRVGGIGDYALLGETLDDAAGEAFDKTAKLLGLGYPGGPALAQLAATGRPGRYRLPRPMLASGDLDMSFSGLKTAVLTEFRARALAPQDKADLAAEFQEAVAEVLVGKSLAAAHSTGIRQLVVAGGVGANQRLRALLNEKAALRNVAVAYPPLEFCTDNGAMVAFAGALRLAAGSFARDPGPPVFTVKPRWDLESAAAVASE